MKVILSTIIFAVSAISLISQPTCTPPSNLISEIENNNVTLTWVSPSLNISTVIKSIRKSNSSHIYDINNECRIFNNPYSDREYLELQFAFPCSNSNGEAGIGTDGTYIYTSLWNGDAFLKYDKEGMRLDSFSINGVTGIRNIVYCENDGYFYGSNPLGASQIYVMDFDTKSLIKEIDLPFECRALAYNGDLDVFYTNNWNSDINVFERLSGEVISSTPITGLYGTYYGFAYDSWSDGGPFLWGFSQDGSGAELVQLSIPDFIETGVVVDLSYLSTESPYAGGLFAIENMIDGKVTLGGLIQNEIIFGLNLGSNNPPPPLSVLSGYNIYQNDILLNDSPVNDTVFEITNLDPGSYNYYITALYDTLGTYYCESDPTNNVTVIIEEQLLLGGNVFAGSSKLDNGKAKGYSIVVDAIELESTVDIDELGYYFFFPFQTNDYYVVANPLPTSIYYNNFISTYFGDVYHWEDSPIIQLYDNEYNQDINLIEITPSTMGIGEILGNVTFEGKDTKIVPAADILMLLLNSNNQCIAFDYTNTSGKFEFKNLANGTYKLLCEIIGKKMSPQLYIIDNMHSSYNGISLLIKNDEILLGIEDNLPSDIGFVGEIYPNPTSSYANINLVVSEKATLLISIFDLSGKLISEQQQILEVGHNEITISTIDIVAGLKIANLRFNNKVSINRKIIIN